ncbi:MAG: LacI family transcriptional regulator [Lachnospiraceae bacterium]|nr:LacI family transcriptional regulator [Lachnospiraceae bacterium]
MQERVRIQDIAEELGVSTATVSNVIHGKTKKVSKETIKRVQELLEKRAYIPSMAGILLAQNDSRVIGVIVNDHVKYEGAVLEDAFLCSALNALLHEIEKSGFFMMMKKTAQWNEIIRFASMWNMEGLVLIGFCQEDYRQLRENMHIPFVVYDGYFEEDSRICNLFVDNHGGGLQMGEYLYQMGHRKVLCIADNHICMDQERMEGCREGMKKGKTDFMKIPCIQEERMRFYEKHIHEIQREYTAVFAVSDEYAIEFMHFLQKKKINVPEDLSVAGFDDIPLCKKVCPELTTIGQDTRERAQKALSALKKIKNKEPVEPLQILKTKLMVRDSVKRIEIEPFENGTVE